MNTVDFPFFCVQPTVSLIVPTFNRAETLRVALRSAQEQTYPSVEIIVLDDASTDSTPTVVQSMAQSSVRYIRNATNYGPNVNWRAGMAAVRGDFFGFLPDDDFLEPTYVERLVRPLIQDEQAILSFCDHWVVDPSGERRGELTARTAVQYGREQLDAGPVDDLARTALIDESVYIGAVLFRSASVPPTYLAPEARTAMGAWILYNCVKTGRPGIYVPGRFMHCRWEDGSVSRSQRWVDAMTEGNINRLRRMLADPSLQSFYDQLERQLAVHLATRGRLLLKRGERSAARTLLMEAMQRAPLPRTAGALALSYTGPVGTGIARMLQGLSGNG